MEATTLVVPVRAERLAPFVQLDVDGAYGYARYLFNLDDPLAEADLWGLHLGGGVNF